MNELDDLMLYATAMTPLIIGFLQLLKAQGLPSRLAPVASLITGLAAMVLINAAVESINWTFAQTIFAGVVSAMAAGGFYSGSKALFATGSQDS